jgi:hypothetical protein
MVLRLKAWESRSPPGPPSREKSPQKTQATRTSRTYGNAASPGTGARAAPAKPPAKPPAEPNARTSSQRQSPQQKPQTRGRANKAPKPTPLPAGWSSPVARQAHNLKVAGSNPAPATKQTPSTQRVDGVSVYSLGADAPLTAQNSASAVQWNCIRCPATSVAELGWTNALFS